MTEQENFLQRWSNRKLGKLDPEPPEQEPERPGAGEEQPAKAEAPASADAQSFDVASLPSIESIGADTDVRGFLQPGVPPDLTRAALRRAWSADPGIRDFVELLENGWDFNDPDAMGGFGPIAPADVPRLVAQAVGDLVHNPQDQPSQSANVATPKTGSSAPASIELKPEPGSESQERQESMASVHRSEDDAAQS
jgi:hypothetical protein